MLKNTRDTTICIVQVFYCEATKEVFTNYDNFFQRTILCNSLGIRLSIYLSDKQLRQLLSKNYPLQLPSYQFIYLPIYLSIYLSIHISIYDKQSQLLQKNYPLCYSLVIHQSIYQSIIINLFPSIYL